MNDTFCKICEIHKSLLLQMDAHSDSAQEILSVTDYWILREAEKEKSCAGYLYLEPRIHTETFVEIPSFAYKELGEFMEKGMHWIQNNFNPKKIYTVTISEAVTHIHFHLVPRYNDSMIGLDYLKFALSGQLKKDI